MRKWFTALFLAGALIGAVGEVYGASYKVVDVIAGPDGGWDMASIDATARRLYVARSDGVMTINLDTRIVTPRVVAGERVHAVVPIPGSDRVLSTNGNSNTATLFQAASGSVIAEISTGQKPDAAVFEPSTGLVFVMNAKGGDVTLVDPHQAKAVGEIPIGGALEFAVADGAGYVFVNIEDQGAIAVLDAASRQVTARYPLKDCEAPSGLAIDIEDKVLVSACANGIAKLVSASDGAEIATLQIGKRPDAVIWDVARKLFFIPSGGDGLLTVIARRSPAEFAVVDQVATRLGARTGALDPATGRIYLPTATLNPTATGRPTPVPGTFVVLVVGGE